jgi:carboxyl-terminal processing protease
MSLRGLWIVTAVLIVLAGCGDPHADSWQRGVFQPAATFANQCASPRRGTDPATGRPYADVAGSSVTENDFLRSWTNETYLWYREVPDLDPAGHATSDYFGLLKTTATTASGRAKDRFHFTYATDKWLAFSQSGVEASYGVQFLWITSQPPRQIVVAYTEPNAPLTSPDARLARGAQVLAVDGVDVVNANDSASLDTINAGLYPSAAGALHAFSILDLGASAPHTVYLLSSNVTSTPVQNVRTLRTARGTVGYLLFNDHIFTAERLLSEAFQQLAAANVSDLVLDIRYNGGGWIAIASEVAYMIAGPGVTAGRTFDRQVFNDKHPTTNLYGQPLTPVPFFATALGFSLPYGQPLPTLRLRRVAILTSANTCSASETIINGLRGVGVEVIEIGATTCGKPYGFYPQDNCGTTYFTIQFQGVNDQSFGDYPDGFAPAGAPDGSLQLPGCAVADDLTHALGDPNERRLAAALRYLAGGGCPAVAAAPSARGAARASSATDGLLHRPPWRENRLDR